MARDDFQDRIERVEQEKRATQEQLRSGAEVTPTLQSSRRRALSKLGESYPRVKAFLFGFTITWGVGGVVLVSRSIPALQETWLSKEANSLFVTLIILGLVGTVIFLLIDNVTSLLDQKREAGEATGLGLFFIGMLVAAFMALSVMDWVGKNLPPPEEPKWWEIWK